MCYFFRPEVEPTPPAAVSAQGRGDNERGEAPNPAGAAGSAQGRDTNAAVSAQGRGDNERGEAPNPAGAAESAQGRASQEAVSAQGREDRGRTLAEHISTLCEIANNDDLPADTRTLAHSIATDLLDEAAYRSQMEARRG